MAGCGSLFKGIAEKSRDNNVANGTLSVSSQIPVSNEGDTEQTLTPISDIFTLIPHDDTKVDKVTGGKLNDRCGKNEVVRY